MRLKQTGALLLASAMIVGSVGIMNPTEVRAAGETNTFTLTVPADTSITQSGWNDIGNVGVSNVSIASDKKISVTIENGATGRNLINTTDSNKKVGYEIKKGNATTNEAFGEKLEFTENGTQAIGADVADFSTAEVGTYEDTINFTAALASATTAVTYERSGKPALSSANLGTPTSWTYSGTTYQVYNAFIPSSSGSNWNDAKGFVAALNTAKFEGHEDWTLLSSKEMATAWYNQFGSSGASTVNRGGVNFLWSSVDGGDGSALSLHCCVDAEWLMDDGSRAYSYYGFVVLQGSSASSAVTYNRTDGTGTLSSADLGTPTEWEYDGATYQVYNEFIPSSSGSGWNDAVGFVNALNTASYGGHSDWTLLSSEAMATAYAANETGAMPLARGGVAYMWSSVECDETNAYCLRCGRGECYPVDKTTADSIFGFVVLRGSSNAPAPTAADVFKENAELVMKLVETNDSFFVLTYKNIGGSFVVQSILSSVNGDITGVYGSACTIANNNPSFTFIFGMESDTMTLNTSTLEYTRTGRTPPMTSFVVDGVELIDTLTDKTN